MLYTQRVIGSYYRFLKDIFNNKETAVLENLQLYRPTKEEKWDYECFVNDKERVRILVCDFWNYDDE